MYLSDEQVTTAKKLKDEAGLHKRFLAKYLRPEVNHGQAEQTEKILRELHESTKRALQ